MFPRDICAPDGCLETEYWNDLWPAADLPACSKRVPRSLRFSRTASLHAQLLHLDVELSTSLQHGKRYVHVHKFQRYDQCRIEIVARNSRQFRVARKSLREIEAVRAWTSYRDDGYWARVRHLSLCILPVLAALACIYAVESQSCSARIPVSRQVFAGFYTLAQDNYIPLRVKDSFPFHHSIPLFPDNRPPIILTHADIMLVF